MNFKDAEDVRRFRKGLGLSQTKFWGQVGVSRSLGSRYETLGSIPDTVTEMLRLVFQEGVTIGTLELADFDALEYLKSTDFARFVELSKLARAEAAQRRVPNRRVEPATDTQDEPAAGRKPS